jgi:hypothetical protein
MAVEEIYNEIVTWGCLTGGLFGLLVLKPHYFGLSGRRRSLVMAEDKLTEGAASPGLLPEGIYLETKKNIIGTGSTAKVAEYRNFWATLRISELVMEMVLLDDTFGLTGIKEKFPTEVVSGPNWLYVEQGEKKYRQLKQKLDQILAPTSAKLPTKATGSASSSQQARKQGTAGATKKTGWWSK